MSPVHDVARIRLDNALLLFDEFVHATVRQADAATLRGLERRFAERLQIQPSYWSQIKARSRQIGERLARQFEQLCRKPAGWMDQPHGTAASAAAAAGISPSAFAPGAAGWPEPAGTAVGSAAAAPAASPSLPQDDDERFIVGLVLTYYRRHPQRARARLLDLLGEVLTPPPDAAPAAPGPAATPAPAPLAPGVRRPARSPAAPAPVDDMALWQRTQSGIAPLKRKP